MGVDRSATDRTTPGGSARASVMWGEKGRRSRGLNGSPVSVPTRSRARSRDAASTVDSRAPAPAAAASTDAGPRSGKVRSPVVHSSNGRLAPSAAAKETASLAARIAPSTAAPSSSPRKASVRCMLSGRTQRRPGLAARKPAQASAREALNVSGSWNAMKTRMARV